MITHMKSRGSEEQQFRSYQKYFEIFNYCTAKEVTVIAYICEEHRQ